jgi:hypothetical protein
MDIRKTYRMQQQYYSGFSFVPIDGVKKHTHFVYKAYTKDHQLYPLFDCVLNKEVLDIYYIVNIRKAISNSCVPHTHAVINDMEYAADAVSLFFKETKGAYLKLSFVERTVRIVQRSLHNFEEVQKKLTSDLSDLLRGHDFTSLNKTSSEDIVNMIDVLQQVCKGIEFSITHLSEFAGALPIKGKDRQPALVAKYCVNNLVEGLQRWCKVQESIIHELEGWRSVRVLHERQEVLN